MVLVRGIMQKVIATFSGTVSATHTISGNARGWFFSIVNSGSADINLTINSNTILIPSGYGYSGPEENISTIQIAITGSTQYSLVVFA